MENNLSIVKDKFKELPNNIEAEQAVIGSILVTKIEPITDCSASILFGSSLNLSFTILKLFSIITFYTKNIYKKFKKNVVDEIV